MMLMTASETAKATGGNYSEETQYTDVTIDSRTVEKGCMYIAIKGDRFDGHDFAVQASESGAACVMVSKDVEGVKCPVIKVADTRRALIDLAAYYRAKKDIPVVGLTGSVGKTTTKEMVAAVLRRKFEVLATLGNLNNDIGLPRMCLQLEEKHTAAVLEMGMNNLGEISLLTKIARPTVGLITNIGVAHIENLKSREGILQAKLEILDGMEKDAPLLLNADDDMLMSARDRIENPIITYGIDNSADCCAKNIVQMDDGMEFSLCWQGEFVPVRIPAVGKHNVYNALAAYAVGRILGLTSEQCVKGLEDYVPSGMRQKIVNRKGITFIEDCYNASPDSIKASMSVLTSLKCTGRRIAVLGEMMELGSYGPEGHSQCGEWADKCGVDMLWAVGGENAQCYIKGASKLTADGNTRLFADKESLAAALAETVTEGDAVLFKASRSVQLEQVIEKLSEAL